MYNQQSDVIALIDVSGTQVVEYGYDAWGKQLWCTGSLAGTVGVENPFRYRGYLLDEETGLYYVRSRSYNPQFARWIMADDVDVLEMGIRHVLGTNLHTYCGNNPVMGQDVTGRWNGWWNSVWFVGNLIDALIAVSSMASAAGTVAYIKKCLRQNRKKIVAKIERTLIKMIGTSIGAFVFNVLNVALTLLGTSLGEIIAKGLDYCDPWWGQKRNDGYVFG